MAFPGDQRHSDGPAPQDEAPFGANNPYSFPPSSPQGPGGEPDGASAEPPVYDEQAQGGFGDPGPYAESNPFGQPSTPSAPVNGSRSLSRGGPAGEGWFGDAAGQQNAVEPDPYAPQGEQGWGAPEGFGGAPEGFGSPAGGLGAPAGGFGGPQPEADPYADPGFGRPGAFAQGGYNQGPPDRSYGQPGDEQHFDKPKSKLPLILGAVVGAVVVVGGGIFAVSALTGGSGKPAASKSSLASSPSSALSTTASPSPAPAATGALGAKLKTQATDPQPLTVGEIFKNAEFKGYKMTATNTSVNCGKQAHGAKLAAALKSGKCTQFLRATYQTTDGKLIGTVGVANLSTAGAAKKAQKAASGTGNWMVPLPGTGVTKKISGKAISLGSAEARGHYLILTWVQRPDGKAIGAGQKSAAQNFATQVPLGSNLNAALQYRGISGKPYGA